MKKTFIPLILISCSLFFACANMGESASYGLSDNAGGAHAISGSACVTVNLDDGYSGYGISKTALPQIMQRAQFDYFLLKGKREGALEYDVLGSWTKSDSTPDAYTSMSTASIAIDAGIWDFSLRASKGGASIYEAHLKGIRLENGTVKNLSFNLSQAQIVMVGKGSITITLNYPDSAKTADKVAAVYALCEQVYGDGDFPTTMEEIHGAGGKYVYQSAADIPAGEYKITYFFYSSSETRTAADKSNWWKDCVGYWREYAIVAGGLASSSEKTIESAGTLFHLKLLESDGTGGTKAVDPTCDPGVTIPVTYTRFSESIPLPMSKADYDDFKADYEDLKKYCLEGLRKQKDDGSWETDDEIKSDSVRKAQLDDMLEDFAYNNSFSYVSKEGYLFDGWYDNPDLEGDCVFVIPAGSVKSYDLYAKWQKTWKITYHYSGKTKVVDLPEGKTCAIYGTDDIAGSIPEGQVLLGWTDDSQATKVKPGYERNAKYTPERDIELYAVFTGELQKTIPIIDETKVPAGESPETCQAAVLFMAKENFACINHNYGKYKDCVIVSDTDGDKLYDWEEFNITNTNPWNKDTDGDGWDDRTELLMRSESTAAFNPLIADLPKLQVLIDSAPYFTYNYTMTNGKTQSDSITRTETGTIGHSSNATNTNAYASSYGVALKFGYKYTWASKGTSHEYSGGLDLTRGWTFTDTYSFSKGESDSYAKAVANGRVNTTNESRTVTGGNVKVALKFANPGDLAYTINSVAVETFRKQTGVLASTPYIVPLGALKAGSSTAMTLQPHSESGSINYEMNLSNQQFEDLMRNTSALEIRVAGYSITMKDNQQKTCDFTSEYTNSRQLTSLINLDYGPTGGRKPDAYYVATKIKPKVESTSSSVKLDVYEDVYLKDLLTICLGEKNFEIENGVLKSVYGLKNAATKKGGSWFVDYVRQENGIDTRYICGPDSDADKNLDDDGFKISAKSVVNIFYDIDEDSDNVPLRVENEFGSSDKKADSDEDGISDYDEISGWVPAEKGKPGVNPGQFIDKKVRTRPNSNDTDGDGWYDRYDPDPTTPRKLNDASLKLLTYSFGLGKGKKNAELPKAGSLWFGTIKADNSTKVWISPVPTLVTSTVKYAVAEVLGNVNPEPPAYSESSVDWKPIPASGIELKRKKTLIFIRVQAPDASASIYRLPIESPFMSMSNVSCSQTPNDDNISLNYAFDSYVDPKTSPTAVRYALAASTTSLRTSLTASDVANIQSSDAARARSTDFIVEIDKEKMKAGRFSVSGFWQSSNYKIAIFAFSGTSDGATGDFYSTCIYSKNGMDTVLARKGKIKVFLNWMRLAWDPNAFNSKPEYIWNIHVTDANGVDVSGGKLSEVKNDQSMSLNMGRYNWVNFSDDQSRYGVDSKSRTSPKVVTIEFNQYENQEFRVKKNILYETAAGKDQSLTDSDYVLKYDKSSKKWTITGDCNYYKTDVKYSPGTDPTTNKPDEYNRGIYNVSEQLSSPGVKKTLETYYSKCSSNKVLVRWEYGGLILNMDFEWLK